MQLEIFFPDDFSSLYAMQCFMCFFKDLCLIFRCLLLLWWPETTLRGKFYFAYSSLSIMRGSHGSNWSRVCEVTTLTACFPWLPQPALSYHPGPPLQGSSASCSLSPSPSVVNQENVLQTVFQETLRFIFEEVGIFLIELIFLEWI